MKDFTFCSPTTIYFGQNKENEVGQIIFNHGIRKILIVFGSNRIEESGLLSQIKSSLDKYHIVYKTLSGVTPNPDVKKVKEGLSIIKAWPVELVLAIGGGSVIDVAKSIACNFYYCGDPYDFNIKVASPTRALKIGVILTLAASGSELSDSCVISNIETSMKGGYNSPFNRPLFAIMNPELTLTAPTKDVMAGVVDIISHSLERYFAKGTKYEFSENIALAIIKNTIEIGNEIIVNPNNYEARASLMLNGAFSHNGLTGLGKEYTFPIHALEHQLSAINPNLAHGVGLAILIPAWMEYVYNYDVPKFARFSREIFDIKVENSVENARIGIARLKQFFKELSLPTTLRECGFDEKQISSISERLTNGGTRVVGQNSVKPLNKKDIAAIFAICF